MAKDVLSSVGMCVEQLVVRRYIDFCCSPGCDVILTSVWGAGVGRRMARAYFGYGVLEI